MAIATAAVAAIAAIAALAGTGVAVYGQQQAASAAKATGKYNAELLRNQAKQEMLALSENARRKTRENERILGVQRAALAQTGLAMEGTPLAILGESAMTLHRDILDMGYDASNKFRNLQASADMSIYSGNQQSRSAKLGAISSGISGIAGAASGYGSATGLFAPKP